TSAYDNRDITQFYAFDEATIHQFPFVPSNAVPKHRFVATGTVSGPWGTTVGAKLTLAGSIPFAVTVCNNLPDNTYYATGSSCQPMALQPKNFFGYRQLDL